MTVSGPIPPTNPFHIARAYALRSAQRPAAAEGVKPAAGAEPVRQPERAGLSPALSRLVGAVVPGRVDFSEDLPRPASDPIPFYRHPADRNAAATILNTGRVLDVNG